MAFITIGDLVDDPVAVTRDAVGERVRVKYGSGSLSLDIGEAVDLVSALIDVLATIPTPEEWKAKELTRDEDRVRAEAQIREEL